IVVFFSSRRRHTSFSRDWSSDVCSSDLVGYSGADLENLLNEAAIAAVQRHAREIAPEDVEQARDKIALGRVRDGVEVSDEDRRRSEERRVGKEGRSRGERHDGKNDSGRR